MTKTVFYVTFYGNGDDIFTPDKQFKNVDELTEFIRWAFANLCNPYEYYVVVDTVDVETGEVLYIGEMNMYVFNTGAMLVYKQTYEACDASIKNVLL